MSASSSDVCVIGAGIVGLAAATSLIDRGVDVACFERGEPGDGQSAGRTRQFRHLHRDPELIEFAVSARELWLRWEERFGRTLLGAEGAIRAGARRFELDALRAAGVLAVEVDAEAARERLPIASDLAGMLLWDPLAGAIRAAATVGALTEHLGASLHRAEVASIGVRGDSVEVRTDAGVHRAARCVVCAGPGTDRLVRPLGLAIHQDRQAHVRLSFRTKEPARAPLPCFSDRSGAGDEIVYALTDLDDRYAVGLATVRDYPAVADLATDVPAGVDLSSERERIIAYVRRVLPGLDPNPVGEVLRLTTTAPEYPEDGFGVWREGPVIAVAGPNLFKFAPAIGERLAEGATGAPGAPGVGERFAEGAMGAPVTGTGVAVEATDQRLRTARGTPAAPSR